MYLDAWWQVPLQILGPLAVDKLKEAAPNIISGLGDLVSGAFGRLKNWVSGNKEPKLKT